MKKYALLMGLGMITRAMTITGMESQEQCQSTVITAMKQSPEQILRQFQQNNPIYTFSRLPLEVVVANEIFSHYLKDKDQLTSLKQSIKTFARLRSVCICFFTLFNFEVIGKFCTSYDKQIKTRALCAVAEDINRDYYVYKNPKNPVIGKEYTYDAKRLYALILVCAGADATVEYNALFKAAVRNDDAQFVDILLKHKVNPYQYSRSGPILHPHTIKIAQVFINNNVDIHHIDQWDKDTSWNILKRIITSNNYSSDLLEFYLTHNVDATRCDPNGSCLLHTLARIYRYDYITKSDNFLNKAKLLLNVIPDMVNTVNQYQETPLDTAQETLVLTKEFQQSMIYKELIALYKKRGGRTAQELSVSEKK